MIRLTGTPGWFAACAAAATACALAASVDAQEKPFLIAPVVLEGNDATGATVGLKWELSDNWKTWKLDPNSFARKELAVDYKLAGVITGDKERNPKNFNDGIVEAKFLYAEYPKPAFAGGLFGKYEADQSLDNRQSVYGVRGTISKLQLLTDTTDSISLDLNFGRVNPSKDLERQTVLGTASLDQYYRWDLEFLFVYPLKAPFHNLEFNYRYFREVDAPAEVKTAGLHEHKLYTFRLGLTSQLFVAYSKGNLPFDRTSEKIFEVGWSHNLKQ